MTATLKPFEPVFPFDDFMGVRERGICFHCRNSPMFCTCTVDAGTDYTMASWDIPPLPADAEPRARLARFLAMSKMHPHNIRIQSNIAWDALFDENLALILETWPRVRSRVMELISSTNAKAYSTPQDKDILMVLRLKKGMKKAGPDDLRETISHAAEKLMGFDWTHMSKFDAMLINNAFQRSDPAKFDTEDAGLHLVYNTNDMIMKYYDGWTSDRGWHISLEE